MNDNVAFHQRLTYVLTACHASSDITPLLLGRLRGDSFLRLLASKVAVVHTMHDYCRQAATHLKKDIKYKTSPEDEKKILMRRIKLYRRSGGPGYGKIVAGYLGIGTILLAVSLFVDYIIYRHHRLYIFP